MAPLGLVLGTFDRALGNEVVTEDAGTGEGAGLFWDPNVGGLGPSGLVGVSFAAEDLVASIRDEALRRVVGGMIGILSWSTTTVLYWRFRCT